MRNGLFENWEGSEKLGKPERKGGYRYKGEIKDKSILSMLIPNLTPTINQSPFSVLLETRFPLFFPKRKKK